MMMIIIIVVIPWWCDAHAYMNYTKLKGIPISSIVLFLGVYVYEQHLNNGIKMKFNIIKDVKMMTIRNERLFMIVSSVISMNL